MDKALSSSKNMGWITPTNILTTVGPIACDPCTWEDNPTSARVFYTLKDDGLKQDWEKEGINFVNPPYGRQQIVWVKKCVGEYLKGCEVELLIPARTDTKLWQQWVFKTSKAICFIEKRIRFVDPVSRTPKDPAPFPSAIVYYGKDVDSFKNKYSKLGHIVI